MHDNVFHAPVKDPKTIVDIGCGTGVATRELAAQFADAQVYGVDLSSLPGHEQRPSNVEFIQGDTRKLMAEGGDARLAPGSVDYVFERLLVLGVTDWPGHVKMVADSVRSGGWVEFHEWDFQVSEGGVNVTDQWPWQQEMVRGGWEAKKLDLRCSQKMAGWMRDAGLVDVKTVSYLAPLGLLDIEAHPEGQKMVEYLAKWWPRTMWLCIPSLMPPADPKYVEGLKAQMLEDLKAARDEQRKSYEIVVCYGRKP